MRRGRRGGALIETAMFLPLLFLLLVGMTELAKLTYVYYTLHKTLYSLARYLGTQQGVNLCDPEDATVVAAKSYAINGTLDNSAESTLANLTPDMIQIRAERSDGNSLGECACTAEGCDIGAGGRAPDFIVVSIPDGYSFRPAIPYMTNETILFRPRVRVPFGGT
jgi:Flp pilus assembly protein TadG